MESKTYTILTSKGLETIIDALNTGQKVNITHIAVGDGGGDTPSINEDMTSLVNEVWRGEVDSVVVADDPKQWVKLTAYIPASEGGFEIREIGAYDDKGQLIAVGTYPVIWKPTEVDGALTELTVKMIIAVSNADAIQLMIDESAQYVTMKELTDIIDTNIQNKASKSFERQGRGDTEHTRQINASLASRSSGVASQVNASRNSNADAGRSQVNASDTATANGIMSQVNASQKSTASHQNSVILSSLGAKTRKDYTIMGGYGDSDFGDEADTTFEIDVKSGEAYYKKDVYTDADRLSEKANKTYVDEKIFEIKDVDLSVVKNDILRLEENKADMDEVEKELESRIPFLNWEDIQAQDLIVKYESSPVVFELEGKGVLLRAKKNTLGDIYINAIDDKTINLGSLDGPLFIPFSNKLVVKGARESSGKAGTIQYILL